MCPTQQHIKEPGVEVAGASGVLAHADGWAGCCPSDGGRAGLQVGHKWLQQHLGQKWLDNNESKFSEFIGMLMSSSKGFLVQNFLTVLERSKTQKLNVFGDMMGNKLLKTWISLQVNNDFWVNKVVLIFDWMERRRNTKFPNIKTIKHHQLFE